MCSRINGLYQASGTHKMTFVACLAKKYDAMGGAVDQFVSMRCSHKASAPHLLQYHLDNPVNNVDDNFDPLRTAVHNNALLWSEKAGVTGMHIIIDIES